MAKSHIPVDLLNPGQVFACLGFVEAAEQLRLPGVAGGFEWTGDAGASFTLSAEGDVDPVKHVLAFLDEADVVAVAPAHSHYDLEKWKLPIQYVDSGDDRFPFPAPSSPEVFPACLTDRQGRSLMIEYWGDATDRDSMKFWAGSGGLPGAARTKKALELIAGGAEAAAVDPFALAAPQSSSFRFDWRRDYIPIGIGFSPNRHEGRIEMVGFPLVEVLAAIGLRNARPQRLSNLDYRYSVIAAPPGPSLLDPIFLRAALGGVTQPFAHRRFRMRLGRPNDRERCITAAFEENPAR